MTTAKPTVSGYRVANSEQRTAKRLVTDFVRDFDSLSTPRWISLMGNTGTGKTHLAKAISGAWRKFRPEISVFTTFEDICNEARSLDYERHECACSAALAVIDDIGAEHATAFSKGLLHQLLEKRLGKWTVITSNLFLNQFGETYDVRDSSRIRRGGQVIEFRETPDYSVANQVWTADAPPDRPSSPRDLPEEELARQEDVQNLIATLTRKLAN